MAEKTPGNTRKSTPGKKTTAKKGSTVTPIDKASNINSNVNTDGGFTQGNGSSQGAGQGSAQAQTSPQSHNSAQSSNTAGLNQGSGRATEITSRTNEGASSRSAEGSRQTGPELAERIRARAYELFEQRGRQEGYHQEDWAQAEAEILGRFEREKSA